MTFFELQQFLKRHGTIIYTGDRLGDLDLMAEEWKELYQLGLLENELYMDGRLLLKKESELEKTKRNNVTKNPIDFPES
ncbi:YqgQ family protein [Evansella tamaricis]|uniref:YqgQ family protein n=1 Tax=Evansella tamaricis TaxID=2069301 RepID=A0ABS6JF03_9BACI|nr:YqgQ family protein [Evansella tamaricis]MBU9712249.1 YqgQ family protein [Evansella tamaricis]